MKVAIIFGSVSDKNVMKKAAEVLRDFGIEFYAKVLSAHRVPDLLRKVVPELEASGVQVFIAGAGLSAALPGAIAALTSRPVIGVPLASGGLGGLDALLAMAQMPKPVPVATVGIDNAANAAHLAVQILALNDEALREKLQRYRENLHADFQDSGEL
jgi:5-(carboxyamino)imidazole ribonucleotide mutase